VKVSSVSFKFLRKAFRDLKLNLDGWMDDGKMDGNMVFCDRHFVNNSADQRLLVVVVVVVSGYYFCW